MRLSQQQKEELLKSPRYLELLSKFPIPDGVRVDNVLINSLPKMSDRAFKLFTEFLIQQSGVENGAALHSEPMGRLAGMLIKPENLAKFEAAFKWIRSQPVGMSAPKVGDGKKGCTGIAQTFWHILQKGKIPTSK